MRQVLFQNIQNEISEVLETTRQILLQNIKNDILAVFETFKNYIKFTRAASIELTQKLATEATALQS